MTYRCNQFKQNETVIFRLRNIHKIVLMKFLSQIIKNQIL